MSKKVGFWKCDYSDSKERREEVEKYVAQLGDWEKYRDNTKEACIKFMKRGEVLNAYRGLAVCRICGYGLGSCDLVYNGWVFPQYWEHYIEEHNVMPNNEDFIKDAVKWFNSGEGIK